MNTKLYKSLATGIATSLLLASLTVAPVSAQSSSDNSQGSGQSQNQGQGMSQGQGQNQGSCATLAQSLGQGQSNISNQNNGNQSNGNNGNGNQNNGNQNNGNGNQNNDQNTNQNSNAQATLGSGAGTAATPVTDCWLSIAPGQKQWYKFHVGARSNKGDENNDKNNANGVDDSDAAIVQLAMDTPGCVTFEIWTLARLNAPPRVGSDASSEAKRKDKEVARGPVGAGSPEFAIVNDNSDNSSDNSNSNNSNSDKNRNLARLIWRGGSTVSENFYIVVRNLRSDFACTYRLSVAGPTVSFPGAINGNNGNGNGNNNGNNGNNSNGNNDNGNNGNGNGG